MADVIRHPGGAAALPLLALAAECRCRPRKCCRWPWHARWMKMHWRGEPLRRWAPIGGSRPTLALLVRVFLIWVTMFAYPVWQVGLQSVRAF